jgi:protein-S-isoprenylcysteine O-methyltransferase Ste14
MVASDWEFKHRATVFGCIFGLSFPLYAVDPTNATQALVQWLARHWQVDTDALTQALLLAASVWLGAVAYVRTWASAYLEAGVVYASAVKSARLVADGPYRHLRNPLYFANVGLAIGMGAFMSRLGCLVAVVAMWVFCRRLILREEAAFDAMGSASYQRYRQAVPRWWPSLAPRTAAGGAPPNWSAAFKAEAWCWGYALAALAFAVTFKFWLFATILAAAIVCFFSFNRDA